MGVTTKGVGTAPDWLRAHIAYQGDDCLIWPFSKNWNGYGHVAINRQVKYAHRVMCIMAHGEPPAPKMVAAHSCGNGHKGCVNPRHLSWKTNSENILERRQHGTSRSQHDGPPGRLTWEQVQEIRALKGKMNQREIAKRFGCSFQNVSMIQQGKTQQRPKQPSYRTSIKAALRSGRPMTPEQVWISARLPSKRSTSNHLGILAKAGEIRRVKHGQYALLNNASDPLST